jgi:hypothetical protein
VLLALSTYQGMVLGAFQQTKARNTA